MGVHSTPDYEGISMAFELRLGCVRREIKSITPHYAPDLQKQKAKDYSEGDLKRHTHAHQESSGVQARIWVGRPPVREMLKEPG